MTSVSKVTLNGQTLMDATSATANASKIVSPYTAMTANGEITEGIADVGFFDDFPVHDGDSHVWISVTEDYLRTVGDVMIYFWQSAKNLVQINWGDGTAPETVDINGQVSPTHTYARAGEYRIDLHVTDDSKTMHFGNSTETIAGRFVDTNYRGYASAPLMHSIETGNRVDYILNGGNVGTRRADFSQSVLVTECPSVQNNYVLTYLRLPPNITRMGSVYQFHNTQCLTEIIIPESLTAVPERLDGSYALTTLIMKPTTPPALGSARIRVKDILKIYVPYSEDHSILNAYKTATNWSTYADYMIEEEP